MSSSREWMDARLRAAAPEETAAEEAPDVVAESKEERRARLLAMAREKRAAQQMVRGGVQRMRLGHGSNLSSLTKKEESQKRAREKRLAKRLATRFGADQKQVRDAVLKGQSVEAVQDVLKRVGSKQPSVKTVDDGEGDWGGELEDSDSEAEAPAAVPKKKKKRGKRRR